MAPSSEVSTRRPQKRHGWVLLLWVAYGIAVIPPTWLLHGYTRIRYVNKPKTQHYEMWGRP